MNVIFWWPVKDDIHFEKKGENRTLKSQRAREREGEKNEIVMCAVEMLFSILIVFFILFLVKGKHERLKNYFNQILNWFFFCNILPIRKNVENNKITIESTYQINDFVYIRLLEFIR